MAREVNAVLAQIIANQRNIPEAKGEEIVKAMRAANQYQVRCPTWTLTRHRVNPVCFFFFPCRISADMDLQEDVWS